MVDFSQLKKNKGNNLKNMTQKLEEMNKGGGGKRDERIYKPGFDQKEGKGYAVVRFLPSKDGENFVRQFSHSFNGPGGLYWERSRRTIEEDDPVAISNSAYWKLAEEKGDESLKDFVRNRKRQTKYYANVYVVKDNQNPDAEGQVFIMEMGPQIWKIVEKAMEPEFDDEEPIDPFDLWYGADFKLKLVGKEIPDRNTGKKKVVPNYENSEFASVSEFMDGDEDKLKEVFDKTYDLTEFTEVKSFDELAKRFQKVAGESYNAKVVDDDGEAKASEKLKQQADTDSEADHSQGQEEKEPEKNEAEEKASEPEADDDDDDLMAEFQRLSQQDD